MFFAKYIDQDKKRIEKKTKQAVKSVQKNIKLLDKMQGLEELIGIMKERKSHA
jgi:hypothetical protein